MDFPALEGNLGRVRAEIAAVQAKAGLDGTVTIVAVTKGHTASAIVEAAECGLYDIGENRVQEALVKRDSLGQAGVRWHLIGHVQTNKAKYVPGRFDLVHSVDSPRIARAIADAMRRAEDMESSKIGVLVQVNASGEKQKYGCTPKTVHDLVGEIREMPELEIRGLMTMAPFTSDERVQRNVFEAVRKLRDGMVSEGTALPILSMGMSNDFRVAVAEGSNMVRLGTVLFGER
ncbi:MAG: YggS family pyridoxal phosphate-dependent enzyme [Gemmatimonadetes bacterium]|nr:YggS family pyridoxal phosphate-dependent enzyme [Gemmatimonadota bacterium]